MWVLKLSQNRMNHLTEDKTIIFPHELQRWSWANTTSDFELTAHWLKTPLPPTSAVISPASAGSETSSHVLKPSAKRRRDHVENIAEQWKHQHAASAAAWVTLPIHLGAAEPRLQLSDWHTDPLQPAKNFITKLIMIWHVRWMDGLRLSTGYLCLQPLWWDL